MTEETSSVDKIRRALDHVVNPMFELCGCMGPRGDQPVCPCLMANVIRWRGKWVQLSVIEKDVPPTDYLKDL